MTGLGTTVIFISMALTASGAATVVMDQMNEVQSQASTTATDALMDVSKGLWVMQILGHSSGGAIDTLELYVKLQPGSPDIAMDEVMLLMLYDDVRMDLEFNASQAGSTSYRCQLVMANSDVSVLWSSIHVIGYKDMAKITITNDAKDLGIKSMKHVTLDFVPASGVALEYGFTTPQIYQNGWFNIR